MKRLAVFGTFDDRGGRSSRIGSCLAEGLGWPHINGGHLNTLEAVHSKDTDVLLWMPQIDNDHPKFLHYFKACNPKLLLISSKRCRDKYADSDVIGHLLRSRSNLGIAIRDRAYIGRIDRPQHRRYSFKLLDPLGNLFVDTDDLAILAEAIKARVQELTAITRCGSSPAGPARAFQLKPEFLDIVRRYGKEFATYVNAINPNRYLGNASTRCALGFPAERHGDVIFVSRRNVSKDIITSDDFVEVLARSYRVEDRLSFWGPQKPSVDTPTQIRLFDHYPAIKFIIHGHVYVKGAPMTESKLPCGAIEEYHEITKVIPARETANAPPRGIPDSAAGIDSWETSAFVVNLRGHGCIIACQDLSYFDTIELKARPFPES